MPWQERKWARGGSPSLWLLILQWMGVLFDESGSARAKGLGRNKRTRKVLTT